MTRLQTLAGAVMAVAALGSAARAQVALGSRLTFVGAANATDLGTPGVRLDFQPSVQAATEGHTGSFARLNRSSGAGVTGSIASLLVGRGPQVIPNLLVIGGYRFTLAALPSGPFGQDECYGVEPALGQTCTPYQSALGNPLPSDPLSPFYLANVDGSAYGAPIAAAVAFNLTGTVVGARGPASSFTGTIYTLFPGYSYQEILGGLEQAGAYGQPLENVTFMGTFTVGGRVGSVDAGDVGSVVTPEPGTVALLGAGLAGVAGMARARRRRA